MHPSKMHPQKAKASSSLSFFREKQTQKEQTDCALEPRFTVVRQRIVSNLAVSKCILDDSNTRKKYHKPQPSKINASEACCESSKEELGKG